MDSEETLIQNGNARLDPFISYNTWIHCLKEISKYLQYCYRRQEPAKLSRFIGNNTKLILQTLPNISSEEGLRRQWPARFVSAAKTLRFPAGAWENDSGRVDWNTLAAKKMEIESQRREKTLGAKRKRKTVELFEREHEYVGEELENLQMGYYAPELSDKRGRQRIRDEIDDFFDPNSPVTNVESLFTAEEPENFEPSDEFLQSTADTQEASTWQTLLCKYEEAYKAMDDARKWRLSTGKVVEDAVYEFGRRCTEEHLSHSFVIDISDPSYITSGTFSQLEMDEIGQTNPKPTPEMPEDLYSYIQTYRKNNLSDLRRVIFSTQTWDQNFDRRTHFDHDWIRQTVYDL
ncbi:hypothetical protein EC973_001091 [Apophysomyces ossiformis]|uniref:Uncharacterized protein n=1 Tax=Apophysomyces ossiformis TaxID=679940 RepID=A0A8H7ENU8_9FUNG|nr:hypothetical protein EC973_001091 [Apophysomyces ossiformis]